MSAFKDHFSSQSKDYAKYRPVYPAALYDFVYSHCKNFGTAWDCGTGNGQVAVELIKKFKTVEATDPSANQIAHASAAVGVNYAVGQAETSGFADNSFDCITVGQALHWFDHARFFAEAKRVAKPGCFFAAWSYALQHITPEIDLVIKKYNEEYVGPYWPLERQYVDLGYNTIPYPFELIEAPKMDLELDMDLDALVGYISTWSSTQRFIKDKGFNPLENIFEELLSLWGDPKTVKKIAWPLHIKAGYLK